MMDITSSAWMSANSDSVIQTVSNYNHYSLTQLICTSLFLSQCIILLILFLGFITERIYQNNMVGIPHLIKYIVPTRRMHKHQYVPAMEYKSLPFSKTAVYSSILTGSILASFCSVPHNI